MSFISAGVEQHLFFLFARVFPSACETPQRGIPPSLTHTLSPMHTHTHTHSRKHTHTHSQIVSLFQARMYVTLNSSPVVFTCLLTTVFLSFGFYPLWYYCSPPLPPSFSLSSRCGWVGESCSSRTDHLPCSAKRPESSGRARAKGCSLRETASLHKPGREDRQRPPLVRENHIVQYFQLKLI